MLLLYFFIVFLAAVIVSFFMGKYSKSFSLIVLGLLTVFFVIYSFVKFYNYNGKIISKYSFLLASFTSSNHSITVNINFSLGLTGFTDLLIITALLVSIFSIIIGNKENGGIFFGLLMFAGYGLTGLFAMRDFLFFFIFWEIVLIPIFFLIARYGSVNKEKISIKFFIYTHVGSLFLLLSIFTLSTYYFIKYSIFTFQIADLMSLSFQSSIPLFALYFSFFGFLLAFFIKLPSFPLHSWLADTYTSSPFSGTVMLSGGLVTMAGYGLLGVLYPVTSLFPKTLVYFIILLGLVSLVYFGLVAMFQTNLKRMIAYTSAAEMSFVTIAFGTAILSTGYVRVLDLSGGMFQTFSHVFVASLAFSALYFIYKRTHTMEIYGLGGLYHKMPLASTFFLASFLASLGLPSLAGFIGEFSITVSSFQTIGLFTVIIIFGLILVAAYLIWGAQRSLFGFYNEKLGELKDLNKIEFTILFFILISSIFVGVYPTLFFKILSLYATHLGGLI